MYWGVKINASYASTVLISMPVMGKVKISSCCFDTSHSFLFVVGTDKDTPPRLMWLKAGDYSFTHSL
ncbi:hypothetical protein, partial [Xenorhabdus littoralis]|uniref:hypothetical protein n=1 Tax=Xenorhabdus littoralis TaxID=2582835 RepID=UPI0029E80AAF